MTEKQKKIIAAAGILLFLLLSGLVFYYAGRPLIRFVSEPERFRAWVESRGFLGCAAFVGMVVLQIIVAVIPGEPLEIAAGYAFGFWEGTLLCLIGMTIGGALVFLFVRKFGAKAVAIFFPQKQIDSFRFLQNKRKVTLFVMLAFLLPGTPKDILSYVAGLAPVRFSHWLLITSLCRLPSVVTSTIGGNALGSGQLLTAGIVFAATVLISTAGYLIYRRLRQKQT